MECNIQCVSWAIYWHDCKLTLFNLMSHVIVLTFEWNAIHKHDTIVIKLQKNKCCTRLFELYWTDTFQREVKHCSSSYESRKNKIIHININ